MLGVAWDEIEVATASAGLWLPWAEGKGEKREEEDHRPRAWRRRPADDASPCLFQKGEQGTELGCVRKGRIDQNMDRPLCHNSPLI